MTVLSSLNTEFIGVEGESKSISLILSSKVSILGSSSLNPLRLRQTSVTLIKTAHGMFDVEVSITVVVEPPISN